MSEELQPVVEPQAEPVPEDKLEKPLTLEEKFEALVKKLAEHGIHVS